MGVCFAEKSIKMINLVQKNLNIYLQKRPLDPLKYMAHLIFLDIMIFEGKHFINVELFYLRK